jgi:hypothetical protein
MPIAMAVQCNEDIIMARSNTGIVVSCLAQDLVLSVCLCFSVFYFIFSCYCPSSVKVVIPNVHKIRCAINIYEQEQIRGHNPWKQKINLTNTVLCVHRSNSYAFGSRVWTCNDN